MKKYTLQILLRFLAGLLRHKRVSVYLGRKDTQNISVLSKDNTLRLLRQTSSHDRKEVTDYVLGYIKELLQKVEQQVSMLVVFYTAEVV